VLATKFSGIVTSALEVGLGQNGAQCRWESITALASIHDSLSMISFNPISEGLSLMEVIGTLGWGLDGKVDWGTETTESLDGRGTGSNTTECVGDGDDGAPPMFLDSWMVIDEILP
jgi:hypothetical protein